MQPLCAIDVLHDTDLTRARQTGVELSRLLDMPGSTTAKVGTAVTQLGHNALQHGGGRMGFWLQEAPPSLRVVVEDEGPGVEHLEGLSDDALPGPTADDTVERLKAARELVDDFSVDSGPERGTRVEIGYDVHLEPLPSAGKLIARLDRAMPPDPVLALRAQNRMLVGLLDELKEERRRVLAQRELLEVLLSHAPVTVWQADEAGNRSPITAESPTGEGSTFQGAEPVIVHPSDRERRQTAWRDLVERGDPYHVEIRVQTAKGWRWVLEQAQEVRSHLGLGARFVGTSTDIDDAKRRELEAERLAELRERMVGVVGHDLRSPLGALQLGLGAVKLVADDPALHEVVKPMEESLRRANRLVSDLLDYVRGSAQSGFPIEPREGDLRGLVEHHVKEAGQNFPEVEIRVEEAGDTRARFDPERLGQALNNLLRNACNHGDGLVRVRVGDRRVEVINDGDPIPEALRDEIFEPFHHAKGRDGLGLGLWIARAIVEGHGGLLAFRSNPEEGTVFTISLPEETARSPEPRPDKG